MAVSYVCVFSILTVSVKTLCNMYGDGSSFDTVTGMWVFQFFFF
jgi:hypothetical protein